MFSLCVVTEQASTFRILATRNHKNRQQRSVLAAKKKDVNGKFARWIVSLQEYLLDVQHVRGTANVVADTLSQSPVGPAEETDPVEHLLAAIQPEGYTPQDIGLLQHTIRRCQTYFPSCARFVDGQSVVYSSAFFLYKGVLDKKSEKRTPSATGSTIHPTKENRCGGRRPLWFGKNTGTGRSAFMVEGIVGVS